MNLNFVVNDYILVWCLLFRNPISQNIYNLRQKIAKTYKNEFQKLLDDKDTILKEQKNFIPDNDEIYNIVITNSDYKEILKVANQKRKYISKLYDENNKLINKYIEDTLRKKIRNYTIFIVNREFNIFEKKVVNKKSATIIVGKDYNKCSKYQMLIDILNEILLIEVENKEKNDDIKNAIFELVINEFETLLTKNSCYHQGDDKIFNVKKQLYPYWLMYLGIPKDEMSKYASRDKIQFNTHMAYEKKLIDLTLEEFIDFCIRNKRYIIKKEPIEVLEL